MANWLRRCWPSWSPAADGDRRGLPARRVAAVAAAAAMLGPVAVAGHACARPAGVGGPRIAARPAGAGGPRIAARPAGAGGSALTGEAPTRLCEVTDERLHELSGLVSTKDGYVGINDSNDTASAMRIFFLDGSCRLTRSVRYPSTARDPEDLATGADGTLWVSDAGDNFNAKTHRESVAVWRLGSGSNTPVLYRMTYPDGHHDCEAMLIDGDGLPVLITKELAGSAALYKPTGALVAGTEQGTPLRLVGRFTPKVTGTANPFGVIGQFAVTGAGTSADRQRVVVRTYADAYVFDLRDRDVVAALRSGPAEVVALPDEPQGESVTFTPDGSALVTVSDAQSATPLLRYPLTTAAPGGEAARSPGPGERAPGSATASPAGQRTSAGATPAGATPSAVAQTGSREGGRVVAALLGGVVLLLGCASLVKRRRGGTGRR